jgi:hypothetical protein
MKLALTVGTLIALGGGTAHAQQGLISGQRKLTPEEKKVIMDALMPRMTAEKPTSSKHR